MTTEMQDVTNEQPQPHNNNDDNIMAMLIYLLSLFTALIGPLIIWLLKKDESPLVDRAGKNYLNYMLSYIIWSVVLAIFTIISILIASIDIEILSIIGFIMILFSVLLLFAFVILSFVFTIIACVKYYNGQEYVIPLTIRFI
ncbi:DUF4870 domain-containing protein [Staphylococcus schweitzeri]|uniref:DUF4870 domain-containing protein n=1 Tax=Staphylococcus schweitzeri TaxID=1654388 RepID=UPI0004FFC752|nr:DUF4870 domain-containing protein [Staphylococcus schweitzeri]CDR25538.1 membrane protein [Staphylococcus schweitzeri]